MIFEPLFLTIMLPVLVASVYVWYELIKKIKYERTRSKIRKATRILSTK